MRIVLDTNCLFSGVVSPESVPAKALQGVLLNPDGLLFSDDLLGEYGRVLRKQQAVERHRLSVTEIDDLVNRIRVLGLLAAPLAGRPCPDPKDQHIWDLLECDTESILVTGERLLLASTDFPRRIYSPRQFVEQFLDPPQPV